MISSLSWLNLLYLWKIFECTSRKLRKEISTLFISIDDESHNFSFRYINTDSIKKRFCQFKWSLRSRFLDIIFVNSYSLRWLINLFLTRRFCKRNWWLIISYYIFFWYLRIHLIERSIYRISYNTSSFLLRANIYIYIHDFFILYEKNHHVEEKCNESIRRNALIESLWFKSCSMYNISQIIIMSQWIWKNSRFWIWYQYFFEFEKTYQYLRKSLNLYYDISIFIWRVLLWKIQISTRKWWDS